MSSAMEAEQPARLVGISSLISGVEKEVGDEGWEVRAWREGLFLLLLLYPPRRKLAVGVERVVEAEKER